MIDLHSHILPGLDDGVGSIEEALALARVVVADGVTVIAGTPHVRHDYPTTPDAMEHALAELRAALATAAIPLAVVAGGEIDLGHLSTLGDDDLRRFSYGGAGKYVLLEFPDRGWSMAIESGVDAVLSAGMVPVLAHPERNAQVAARPESLAALVRRGALVQITAASVEGRLGRTALACATRLVDLRLAHLLASDAHGPSVREARLAAAAATFGDEALSRYLTQDAPAAVLAGEPVGEPPALRSRRRWLIRGGFGNKGQT